MAEPTLSKKRYVPMTEASRISGYTDDYIERLCRIGKIPCRVMGEKMIVELDALLAETGTILLGGERVGFIEVDDEERFPVVPVAGAVEMPEEEVRDEGPHIGSIAVVGETVHSEEERRPEESSSTKEVATERFPSNALPFFSSVAQKQGVKGVHIKVSSGEAGVWVRPVPHQSVKLAIHEEEDPIGLFPSSSTVEGDVKVEDSPNGPSSNETHEGVKAVPSPYPEEYASKLPMVIDPRTLSGKAALSVLALGLFVLPTALGVGNVLSGAILDLDHVLRVSTRATLAAVGIISPEREVQTFPYLGETSQLLSAIGAVGEGGTNGIVLAPLASAPSTNDQMAAVIQDTFSDPVQVIPDGKDGRTGTIRPTFTKSGTGYMYIMVPVRQ